MEGQSTDSGLEDVPPWFLVVLIQCPEGATTHLDRGQNIDEVDSYDGKTAINMAAAGGHLDLVSLLLSRRADTSIADCTGRTPLMSAAEENQLAIVKLLLVQCAGHDAWHQAAALWLATRAGNPEVVRVLLAAGVDEEKLVYRGQCTARQLAAARGEGDECLRVMQWFEGEARRCRMLHKARRLHDMNARMAGRPEEEEPWSLFFDRLLGNQPLPQLKLVPPQAMTQGKRRRHDSEEEDEVAMHLRFSIYDLPQELYTELQAGLWVEGHSKSHTHEAA